MDEIKKLDKEIIKNEDKIVINNKKILELLKNM